MNSGRRTARQEEELYVQRRNAEVRKQEHWNSVAKYFKVWDVKASKYASWTSDKYFQQSEEARLEMENKKKKEQTLEERREKLKEVLESEQKLYSDEIKAKRMGGRIGASWMPIEELKGVNLELKRKAEEARKREAELLLYHKWRQEQPVLRDFERRQNLEFTKKSWLEQIKEKEAAKEKQMAEEALRLKEQEIKRQEEEKLEKLRLERKKKEVKELKEEIFKQMEAINKSVQMSKDLEKQEGEEIKLQSEVEQLIAQRKLAEKKKENKHLAAFWTRQYQLKIQKKSKEIEEEVAQDLKLLQNLEKELKQEEKAKADAREIAKNEMKLAMKELEIHKQREMIRQREYEYLYSEQAKAAWEKLEKRWEEEKKARELLMQDVLDTIKKQIKEKVERNSAMRVQELKDRENMLKEVNRLYEECNKRELEIQRSREQYRKDLDVQVAEKTEELTRKVLLEADIEKKQFEENLKVEKKLEEETKKLQLCPDNYKPPDFRRRRVVW